MPRPKKERRSEGPRFTRSKGWVARVWEQDGTCSGWLSLNTSDQQQAKRLLATWVRTGMRPAETRGEKSFAEEAERVLADKEQAAPSLEEKKKVQYRRERLRKYALPVIGQVPVGLLETGHIMGLLDEMAAGGASARTIHNLRSDVSVILAKLVRERELKLNPARGAQLPEDAPVDTRERMHLSDEQMALFQSKRGFATPLDVNVMLCRGVSGSRTSDGHAGDWSHVDLEHFAMMKVRRPKTDGQVGQRVGQRRAKTKSYEYADHAIPERYRAPLRAYWESLGKPVAGPLFPLQRDAVATPMKLTDGRVIERQGGKVGGRKGRGTSYAKAFRRAVWGAKIYAPLPGFDAARPDKRLCAFQTDTDTTRRLTFHGIRAELNAALVEAGVTVDQRIAIMGHTQAVTGNKHYMKRILVGVPESALPAAAIPPKVGPVWEETGFHPDFGMKPLLSVPGETANSADLLARPSGFEPLTFGSVEEGSSSESSRNPENPAANAIADRDLESPSETVSTQTLGGNDTSREALLEAAARAVREGDWERADRIRAILGAPPKLALLHKLSRTHKLAR